MMEVEWKFAEAQRIGGDVLDRLRARYLARMWDLSEFMKTLKQKFTLWFNRKHDRIGVLWESRFKSVVVEGDWNSLLKVAAYIDLNSVRAGMAEGDEGKQPEKASIAHTDKEAPGQGKGSLWGSPYSGRPVDFDDVKIEAAQE